MGHQARAVQHDVNLAVRCGRAVNQRLDLRDVGHIRRHRCSGGEAKFGGERLEPVGPARAQHQRRALCRQVAGGGRA